MRTLGPRGHVRSAIPPRPDLLHNSLNLYLPLNQLRHELLREPHGIVHHAYLQPNAVFFRPYDRNSQLGWEAGIIAHGFPQMEMN